MAARNDPDGFLQEMITLNDIWILAAAFFLGGLLGAGLMSLLCWLHEDDNDEDDDD